MTSERSVEHPARVGAIGAAITAFAFLDAYTVGLLIAALDAWLSALIVFAVAAGYSIVFAAAFSAIGFAAGDAISAA